MYNRPYGCFQKEGFSPKSSILIGFFSIIFTPIFGSTPIFFAIVGTAVLETHCGQTLQQMGGIDSTAHLDGRRRKEENLLMPLQKLETIFILLIVLIYIYIIYYIILYYIIYIYYIILYYIILYYIILYFIILCIYTILYISIMYP